MWRPCRCFRIKVHGILPLVGNRSPCRALGGLVGFFPLNAPASTTLRTLPIKNFSALTRTLDVVSINRSVLFDLTLIASRQTSSRRRGKTLAIFQYSQPSSLWSRRIPFHLERPPWLQLFTTCQTSGMNTHRISKNVSLSPHLICDPTNYFVVYSRAILVDPNGIAPFLPYVHSDLSRIIDKDFEPEQQASSVLDITGHARQSRCGDDDFELYWDLKRVTFGGIFTATVTAIVTAVLSVVFVCVLLPYIDVE